MEKKGIWGWFSRIMVIVLIWVFLCFDIGVYLGGIVRMLVDNGLFDFRVQVDYGDGILVRIESSWLWILLGIVFGDIWYTDFGYLSYWEE